MSKTAKIFLPLLLVIILGVAAFFFIYLRRQEDFPALGISRDASDHFIEKISSLAGPSPSTANVVDFSEPEINSFLHYHLDQSPVQGIKRLQVSLADQLATIRARVNFDELSLEKTGGKSTLWRIILQGEHNLELTTILNTKDGVGQYQVQSAKFDQGEIPKSLLNMLVSKLAAKKIPGVEPDGSFRLPKGIDRIEIKPGRAIVFRKTN